MSEAAPILSVRNVSKHFGGVQALSKVSFDIHPGEVVALAGDNGAGKSTVIKAISGVFRYDEGDIELDGRRIAFSSPQEARDNGIETIYQDLALADNLSIGANIFLGREPMTKRFGFLPVIDRKMMAEAAQGDDGEARLPRRAVSMRRSRHFRAGSARQWPSAAPCTGMRASSSWTSRRPHSAFPSS